MHDAGGHEVIFPVAMKGPAAAQWRGQAVPIILPDDRLGGRGMVESRCARGKGHDTSTMCWCLTW